MKWERIGQWVERSSCGAYKVSAAKVDGKFVFQAYHGRELLLTASGDAQRCREACEGHSTRGEKHVA